jgi:hypothetical protein
MINNVPALLLLLPPLLLLLLTDLNLLVMARLSAALKRSALP